MRTFFAVFVFATLAVSVSGQNVVNFGWENGGDLPSLSSQGPQTNGPVGTFQNFTGSENGVSPFDGSSMLKFTDTGASGTPAVVIAFISGLNEGDTVTVSFRGNAPSTAGSGIRQWASWRNLDGTYSTSGAGAATSGDLNKYFGKAGWEASDAITYTVPTGQTVLGIEARSYQSSSDVTPVPFYIDALTISAPATAVIVTAVPEPATIASIMGLLGLAFVMFRRRR